MGKLIREKVLYRDDGALFSYTDVLAARPDMTVGFLGDPPPKPKLEVAAAVVADEAPVPLEADALPALTPERLDGMSKDEVLQYADGRFGKKLDKRKNIENLRSDLWRLWERDQATPPVELA